MKVLFVARNIPVPDHQENDIILQLAKQLEAREVRASLIYPAEWLPVPSKYLSGIYRAISALGKTFVVDGVEVRVLKFLRLPSLAFSYLLCGFFWPKLNIRDMDIIHAHYVMPDGWIGLKLSRQSGCPLVVTVRQGDMYKYDRLSKWAPVRAMYRQVLKSADLVFSPSLSVVNQLNSLGFPAKLMPHGVDDTDLAPRRFESDGKVRVLVAASLISSKRVDWVIRALGSYRGQYAIELVVLGEGECRFELQELAKQLSLDCHFPGRVSREKVFEAMHWADIFALPSKRETFGLVYLEAALQECAVIAIEGTGVHGCFVHEEEVLFSSDDFANFRDDLWRLIDDGESRVQMAKKARLRVKRDYLWDTVVENYLTSMAIVS